MVIKANPLLANVVTSNRYLYKNRYHVIQQVKDYFHKIDLLEIYGDKLCH